jgi:hypothetical protein
MPVEHVSAVVQEAPALATPEVTSPAETVPNAVQELAPVAVVPVEAVSAAVQEAPAVVELPVEATTATAEAAPAIAPPLPEPTYDPNPLCHALELHAEAALHAIQAELEAFQSRIRAIVATFEARPVAALLAAPREIVQAPAPPATQWQRARKPSIPSVKPCDPNSNSLSTGPLTSALAGPALPADLRTLIEHKSTKSVGPRKRATVPAWFISVLVATALFLGAGSLLQYVSENRDSKAAPVATPQPVQPSAGISSAAGVGPHPFARFVEIAGLRVVADLNHKSQLQYLVVNHSSTRLSDLALKIAVRSASDSSGSTPMFTLSVVVPTLGPYQSKEIKTDLDAGLRSAAIPEWENLRAEVQVSTKP